MYHHNNWLFGLSITAAVLIAASSLHAAVIYVDANATNTTVNGNAMVIQNQNTSGTYVSGVDFNVGSNPFTGSVTDWLQRTPFANSGNAFQQPNVPGADVLNTSVSGLTSGMYRVYAYFWDATPAASDWDLAAQLNGGGYMEKAASSPGVPLASGQPFTTLVLTAEGNRLMYAIELGTFTGTSFTVDARGGTAGVVAGVITDVRTWYDGVGYAVAVPTVVDSIIFNANTNIVSEGDEAPGLGANFTSSAAIGADNPIDAFGNNNGAVEATSFIFADSGILDNGNGILGDGGETVDFIEWETTSLIELAGYQINLSGDGGGANRATELVRFLVEGVEVDLFDNNAFGGTIDRIFAGGPVMGDSFRIEFTRTIATGPRIFEINAILADNTVVPEPSSIGLWLLAGFSVAILRWRRRIRET